MASYRLFFVNSTGAKIAGMEATVVANDEPSIKTMSKALLTRGIKVNIASLG